jgi:hypothetical protein
MLCAILNYDYFENEKLYNTSRINNNMKKLTLDYIKDRLSYIKEVVSTW